MALGTNPDYIKIEMNDNGNGGVRVVYTIIGTYDMTTVMTTYYTILETSYATLNGILNGTQGETSNVLKVQVG